MNTQDLLQSLQTLIQSSEATSEEQEGMLLVLDQFEDLLQEIANRNNDMYYMIGIEDEE